MKFYNEVTTAGVSIGRLCAVCVVKDRIKYPGSTIRHKLVVPREDRPWCSGCRKTFNTVKNNKKRAVFTAAIFLLLLLCSCSHKPDFDPCGSKGLFDVWRN